LQYLIRKRRQVPDVYQMVDEMRSLPGDRSQSCHAHKQYFRPDERRDQQHDHRELEPADVSDEMLVIRAVSRDPPMPEPGESFPERMRGELRLRPDQERRDRQEQQSSPYQPAPSQAASLMLTSARKNSSQVIVPYRLSGQTIAPSRNARAVLPGNGSLTMRFLLPLTLR